MAPPENSPFHHGLLEKVYSLLGLPREQLYSDLHSSGQEDEPIVVETAGPRSEFAVPINSSPNDSALDMSRVERTLEETRALQELLGQIFSEEQPTEPERRHSSVESSIDGLDAAHANLLRRLSEQSDWPIADFEALCEGEGLLPGGAGEILNEFSFERADSLLLEGEDPVVIDQQIAREFMQ